jgi:hypothetical protein
MFGRKKIKALEIEVSELKSKIKAQVERVNEALETERKSIEWAEKLKSDAENIVKERDELRTKVREQTDNDIAIAALKTLGIVPTGKKPGKSDIDRLMAQRQWVAAAQSGLTPSPLGSAYYGSHNPLNVTGISGLTGGLFR